MKEVAQIKILWLIFQDECHLSRNISKKLFQQITDKNYVEELIILTVVASILLATKIIACCLALGLNQKHKAISLRRDSLSIAK